MIKILFAIIILFQTFVMAQENLTQLKQKILDTLQTVPGDFAVAFQMLDSSNASLFINEKEEFHAASTMKTPVMIEVFKQASEGKFSLDDSVTVKNEFKSIADGSVYSLNINDDSGENLYHYIGKKRTIRQLVYDMVTVSSNLATNILIDIVGAENVMKTMKEIGANDIKVLRGVEDIKAFDKGMNNTTTAYDLMLIFEEIAEGKIISKEDCDKMINILSGQELNSKIPALLPKDIRVAHKTGSITGVEHDSGIVFLPDGRKYVLVLLSKNLKNQEDGIKTEAKVSRMIFDYLNK